MPQGDYNRIKGKGNRFSSTNQPQNRGRKPKLYTIAKKVYNVSRDEWDRVKLHILQCTRDELDGIINDKETPIWVLILCRGLKHNAAKGMTNVLNDMEDRLFGRAAISSEKEDEITEGSIDIEKWINENTDDETKD